METEITIKTFNGTIAENTFFVLSRGRNSGKPLKKPCPNCYAITAPPEQLAFVRSVAFILFQSGRLRPLFVGSVIDFIRLSDYRKAFITLWQSLNPQCVEVAAKQINAVEQETERLQRQIELLHQLRKAIAFLALDEKKSKK